jgi:hypothetical protein
MSTLIRNTTTLECGIDRRVDRAGHGEHGGWSLSQGTTIICLCGERLFELADLKAAVRGAPELRTATRTWAGWPGFRTWKRSRASSRDGSLWSGRSGPPARRGATNA